MAAGDIVIKTTLTPDLVFNPISPASAGNGFDFGKYFKPAIYITDNQGNQQPLYTPYGTPQNYFTAVMVAIVILILYVLFR